MNFLINDLKLNRFIFSLPWLLVSYLLLLFSYPAQNQSIAFWTAILVSFFGARCLGMSLNQIFDVDFDRRNVRTKNRALASGMLSLSKAYAVATVSFLLLILPLLFIGTTIFLYASVPILLIMTYSLTKRWTPFCHFWLGSIYFFLPTALSLALYGKIHQESVLLGAAFAAFITAGDLLYSIQDRLIDQQEGLKSFPETFGVEKTVWMARFLVLLGLICLGSLHLYVSCLALSLLWGRFLFFKAITEDTVANRAFQTCNTFGALLLLLTFWV